MDQPPRVQQYFLTADNGFSVTLLNYGAVIQSIKVPSSKAQTEVCLGYLRPDEYVTDNACLGAVVGRYCNRIAYGQYSTQRGTFQLPVNNNEHHLHGGPNGFHKKYWEFVERFDGDSPGIKLSCTSIDGEEGYPGNVTATATYRIVNGKRLVLDLEATSDQETPLNLTGHAYFNLNSDPSSIENHHLHVNANQYLPVDASCLPTGEIKEVKGSDFDFTNSTALGARIHSDNPQIAQLSGIDHNFVLANPTKDTQLAATVFSPQSHIQLRVYTNMPGLQVYTGNHLSGQHQPYQGLCLEPQYYPDSPNQRHFPNCFLQPGETYHHQIIYEFGWE